MKTNISKKILREFGFIIGFLFPLLIGFVFSKLSGHSFKTWTLWVSFPLIFLAIIRPNYLLYPYRFWIKIGHILSWLNSRIILGFVFLLVLQPIALIMRIFGHDPLRIKKHGQKSYREVINNKKVNFKKIF